MSTAKLFIRLAVAAWTARRVMIRTAELEEQRED